MKLLLENWREYIKEEDEFQPPTQEAVDADIDEYLKKLGLTRDDVDISEVVTITDSSEIASLANQAREMEGAIQDEMLDNIRRARAIEKPVIIDKGTTDRIVDGKHRFIAAAEYGLDLPVVYISAKETA
jgi:hypothetical protein